MESGNEKEQTEAVMAWLRLITYKTLPLDVSQQRYWEKKCDKYVGQWKKEG